MNLNNAKLANLFPERETVTPATKEIVVQEVAAPVMTDADGRTWTGNIALSSSGVEFADDVTFEEWKSFFGAIEAITRWRQFVIGDWFVYGVDRFHITYEQVAQLTGYSPNSIENYASIARSVPKFTRVNSLSYNHHKVVAKLPVSEQERWLQEASLRNLSYRDLQAEVDTFLGIEQKHRKAAKRGDVINRRAYKAALKRSYEERVALAGELQRMADELIIR